MCARMLGKKEAKRDPRNFQLGKILKKGLAPLPDSFDCDQHLKTRIPAKMFGNNKWQDCVIATRGNQTLRFEYFEQKKVLPIPDEDILNEYWAEQDGDSSTRPDTGLLILDSLNLWRKRGWTVLGNKYDIYAFAEIDRTNHEEVKRGIYHLNGAFVGLWLPKTAKTQFNLFMKWDVCKWKMCKEDSEPGSLGGHAVFVCGWYEDGLVCTTWGRKQKMTWEFFDKYCDEAYCIVDNRDNFLANSPVDVEALDGYLKTLKH